MPEKPKTPDPKAPAKAPAPTTAKDTPPFPAKKSGESKEITDTKKTPVQPDPQPAEKPKQKAIIKEPEKPSPPPKSEKEAVPSPPAKTSPEKKSEPPAPEVPSEKKPEATVVPEKSLEKSAEQEPAATPPPAASPRGTANLKGVTITQVFADRLNYPSADDLKSLPIPKEGEGFSMRLHPSYFFHFLDHPFSINREVKDYKDLFESIRENGINEPIKARPRAEGGLELLSGHRRHDVARQLNYPVPVVIVQADDDTARIEVVDGNLHRQDIPTSELARAAQPRQCSSPPGANCPSIHVQ